MHEQPSAFLNKLTLRAFIINFYHYLGDMMISTFSLVDQCQENTISKTRPFRKNHCAETPGRLAQGNDALGGIFVSIPLIVHAWSSCGGEAGPSDGSPCHRRRRRGRPSRCGFDDAWTGWMIHQTSCRRFHTSAASLRCECGCA